MKYSIFSILIIGLVLTQDIIAQRSDSTKKVKIAALPVVNYNHSFGFTIGAMAMGFYKLNEKDTISPPSSTGLFLGATTNKSWFGLAFQKFYFNEDKYRATIAGGVVSVNFQTFIDIPIGGGIFVDYNTEADFIYFDFQFETLPDLYIGPKLMFVNSTTIFDLNDTIPEISKGQNMNNFGMVLSYDTRDNVNNPSKGIFTNFNPAFYRPGMGSTYNFNLLEFDYNHFIKLKEGMTILGRFKTSVSTGDVPFEGQRIVGRDDIRGYTKGKHRGDQVYALQSEIRWNFYKKIGMVGFIGVASAVDKFKDLSVDNLLPGAGAGLRYMAIESEKINIGIDIAVGKEDWGLYFRIGEAFGR